MESLLGLLSEEVRQLVREHRIVANGWTGLAADIPEDADEVGLGDEGGPRRVERAPSSSELRAAWAARYASLSATNHLMEMIPDLRERLLIATASMPHEFPRGRLSSEEIKRLRALFSPVRRAVSFYARFIHAVEMIRSVLAHSLGEHDGSGFDAYAIGGLTMRDPRYKPYDRLRCKLARSSPKVIAGQKERDATPERRSARAARVTERRTDPAFRAAENAARRRRYDAKKAHAKMVSDILTTIEADNQTGNNQ